MKNLHKHDICKPPSSLRKLGTPKINLDYKISCLRSAKKLIELTPTKEKGKFILQS
jgi:hypothetical protein